MSTDILALALQFWFVFNALPFFMNANTMKMKGTRLQLWYSLFLLLCLEFMVLHHLEVVGCSIVVGLEGESMPQ